MLKRELLKCLDTNTNTGYKLRTMYKKIQIQNQNYADYIYQAKNYIHKVFSDNQELQLVNYYLQAVRLHYGLTKKKMQ